jgi:hypothetical protein
VHVGSNVHVQLRITTNHPITLTGSLSAPHTRDARPCKPTCIPCSSSSSMLSCLLLHAGTLTPSRCAWSCPGRWRRWRRRRRPTTARPTSTARVGGTPPCAAAPPAQLCRVKLACQWTLCVVPTLLAAAIVRFLVYTRPAEPPSKAGHASPPAGLLTMRSTSASCIGAAGLGRAPATALAYMWWFKGWHLEDAYEHLTGGLGVPRLCLHLAHG